MHPKPPFEYQEQDKWEPSWSYTDQHGFLREIVYVYGTCYTDEDMVPAAGCGVCFGISHRQNLSYGLEDDENPDVEARENQDILQAQAAALFLAYSEIFLRRVDGQRFEIRTTSKRAIALLSEWSDRWEAYEPDNYNGNKAVDFTVKSLSVDFQMPRETVVLKLIDSDVDSEGIDTAFGLAWDGVDGCLCRRREKLRRSRWVEKLVAEFEPE